MSTDDDSAYNLVQLKILQSWNKEEKLGNNIYISSDVNTSKHNHYPLWHSCGAYQLISIRFIYLPQKYKQTSMHELIHCYMV